MQLLSNFNGLVCLGLFLCVMWLILDVRVKDGILVKFGLICVSLGFLTCSVGNFQREWVPLEAGQVLLGLGAAICFAGYQVRTQFGRRKLRRKTDWADLDAKGARHV